MASVNTNFSSATTGAALTIPTRLYSRLTISGAFVANIMVQYSFDNVTWWDSQFNYNSAYDGPILNLFRSPFNAYQLVDNAFMRLKCTTYTSGTANTTIQN